MRCFFLPYAVPLSEKRGLGGTVQCRLMGKDQGSTRPSPGQLWTRGSSPRVTERSNLTRLFPAGALSLALEEVGDGVPIAFHSRQVIAQRSACYAVQVAALVVIGQGQVGNPGRLPKPHLVAPLSLGTGTSRDPCIDADRRRIAAGLFGVATQGGDCCSRFLTGRIGERHPAVTPFGAAAQGYV